MVSGSVSGSISFSLSRSLFNFRTWNPPLLRSIISPPTSQFSIHSHNLCAICICILNSSLRLLRLLLPLVSLGICNAHAHKRLAFGFCSGVLFCAGGQFAVSAVSLNYSTNQMHAHFSNEQKCGNTRRTNC